jgi:DNA modification methylase
MKITQIENSILINEDCLKAMDFLIEKGIKVDGVITDPPYELENHGGTRSAMAKRAAKVRDEIEFIANGFDYNLAFEKMLALCKIPNLIIFCSNNQISKIMSFFESKKLSTTLLVWKKSNPSPLCNGKHVSDLEFIVYVRGKGAVWNHEAPLEYKYKCKTYPFVSPKQRKHPTEKPIKLMEELITLHTLEGGVVLDPFGGSLTTGVACQNLNRRFIGIEWNPSRDKEGNLVEPDKYFNIGVKRMQDNLERLKNASN